MEISIKDLKNRDERVWKQFVSDNQMRLYKFTVRFVLDKEIAKEIVQDGFLALWEKRECLPDDTNLLQYIFRVIRNKSLNYLRDLKLETLPIDSLEECDIYRRSNIYVLEDPVLENLFVEDLKEIINKSLSKLSPQTREIFNLSRNQNLPNKIIAEKMCLTEKSVEYHITKAIKQLKSDLPEEYKTILVILFIYHLDKLLY